MERLTMVCRCGWIKKSKYWKSWEIKIHELFASYMEWLTRKINKFISWLGKDVPGLEISADKDKSMLKILSIKKLIFFSNGLKTVPAICIENIFKLKNIIKSCTSLHFHCTFNICSFSLANKDTEPKTSLNSFRYRLDRSRLAEKSIHKKANLRYISWIIKTSFPPFLINTQPYTCPATFLSSVCQIIKHKTISQYPLYTNL